ncbi:MAG: regulatory protein GemA [Defluviitaleaceae bacterium]|nr:regulatory protein GemA [Defluviitaleaceae bacterium]
MNKTTEARKMSDAQRRMIFRLAKEQGLDEDVLRSYVDSITGKSGLRDLTTQDAIKIIDGLSGTKQVTRPDGKRTISDKQRRYIEGMAKELGWTKENEKGKTEVDMIRLGKWLENKYGCSYVGWLSSKLASDAIEGLKKMAERERKIKEIREA